VGGNVRVNDAHRNSASLLLAKHWYFSGERYRFSPLGDAGARNVNDHKYRGCTVALADGCFGVMLGVGIGSSGTSQSQVISMVGAGVLFGWNRAGTDVQNAGHNVGIGIGRSFGVQVLGDGFHENAPPPAGETQVRYRTTDVKTYFIFYTYSWGSGNGNPPSSTQHPDWIK
jgi:hypothetical protein